MSEDEGRITKSGRYVEDEDDFTDEEGREVMLEALADLFELADSEEMEPLADVMFWILTHDKWLPEDQNYDGLLLLFIRTVLSLGDVDMALEAREYLDLEVVSSDPIMAAENAIHDMAVAQLRGDVAALRRAAQSAAALVRLSDEPQHHEMLRSGLAALGSVSVDATSALSESLTRDLGTSAEIRASEHILAAIGAFRRGEDTLGLEEKLVALASDLSDGGYLLPAAGALGTAGQFAMARGDVATGETCINGARHLVCSQLSTAGHPVRSYLDMVYSSVMRVRKRPEIAKRVMEGALRGYPQRGLFAGLAHLFRATHMLDEDPWASLSAGLTAHEMLMEDRATMPTVGERAQMDEMASGAAEVVLRAAERLDDPSIFAEALEILRMQGLPSPVASGSSVAPMWMLVDLLGLPATRPAWQTRQERQPAVLAGVRPVPVMPWGGVQLQVMFPSGARENGHIVDIRVVR